MDMMEMLQWLTNDQKGRYIALEKMFDTEGWKMTQKWAEDQAFQAGVRGANAGDWDENRKALGARLVYEEISSLADRTLTEFEQIAIAAQLEDQEKDMEDFE